MNREFLHHCLTTALEVHIIIHKVHEELSAKPDQPIMFETDGIMKLLESKGFTVYLGEESYVLDINEDLGQWIATGAEECGAFKFAHNLYHLFQEGEAKH